MGGLLGMNSVDGLGEEGEVAGNFAGTATGEESDEGAVGGDTVLL